MSSTPQGDPETGVDRSGWWRANLRLVSVLLAIWASVSLGAGVLLAPWLDRFTLPGTHFPLGFWFAQQGAIYVFVLLIAVYVVAARRLEARFRVDREEDKA